MERVDCEIAAAVLEGMAYSCADARDEAARDRVPSPPHSQAILDAISGRRAASAEVDALWAELTQLVNAGDKAVRDAWASVSSYRDSTGRLGELLRLLATNNGSAIRGLESALGAAGIQAMIERYGGDPRRRWATLIADALSKADRAMNSASGSRREERLRKLRRLVYKMHAVRYSIERARQA